MTGLPMSFRNTLASLSATEGSYMKWTDFGIGTGFATSGLSSAMPHVNRGPASLLPYCLSSFFAMAFCRWVGLTRSHDTAPTAPARWRTAFRPCRRAWPAARTAWPRPHWGTGRRTCRRCSRRRRSGTGPRFPSGTRSAASGTWGSRSGRCGRPPALSPVASLRFLNPGRERRERLANVPRSHDSRPLALCQLRFKGGVLPRVRDLLRCPQKVVPLLQVVDGVPRSEESPEGLFDLLLRHALLEAVPEVPPAGAGQPDR